MTIFLHLSYSPKLFQRVIQVLELHGDLLENPQQPTFRVGGEWPQSCPASGRDSRGFPFQLGLGKS